MVNAGVQIKIMKIWKVYSFSRQLGNNQIITDENLSNILNNMQRAGKQIKEILYINNEDRYKIIYTTED